MCGRYRLSRRKQLIEEQFETQSWDDDWSPRYNIAPTQHVPVIRQHAKEPIRQLSLMKWGLIPHWAKDASSAAGTINARSETAAEKPAFRDPFKHRRCPIPADAFYEWKRNGTSKQPYCFEVNEGELSNLIATVRKTLPEFAKACADEEELVLLHQDAFAADYQEDEYMLLGMAIKYAGLRGKEVRVIGKSRSSLGEEDRVQ